MCIPLGHDIARVSRGVPKFMDEPTGGLDPLVRSQLLDILKDYMSKGGKGVFYFIAPINPKERRCYNLALSEQRKEYLYDYQKAKLKRIPLDVPKEKYEKIKTVAQKTGESVNGYIKKAVDERMQRDTQPDE